MSDLLDISHLFKVREDPEFFSVWYDVSNGHITDIAPHSIAEDRGNFIVGSGEPYLSLIGGNVPFKEYVVAYDPDVEKNRLMHMSEWSKLLGEKHELQVVDFVEELDNTKQFFLSFYKEQKTCELIINHDSFAALLKMGNEEQISASQNQTIDFFVRDKSTGYLIAKHRFYFDMDNDIIMDDKAEWLGSTDINEIEVLGFKNLCTYNWSWQKKRIARSVRVNRTRVIPASRNEENYHINMRIVNGKLHGDSYINEPANYNIHDKLKIWVTKREHPDALIGSIDIPSVFIEGKRSFEIEYAHLGKLNLDEVDFLIDNQYIKLHMEEA